jgi:hypothetical protein
MQMPFLQKATPVHCYIKYVKPLDCPHVLMFDVHNSSPYKQGQNTWCLLVIVVLTYSSVHSSV